MAHLAKRDVLDVVVRLYEPADIPLVRTCLFTLLGQRRRRDGTEILSEAFRVCVMTQRFSAQQVSNVRDALRPVLNLDDEVSLAIHNWDYRDPFDVRVPLLNYAMEVSDARWMTFVECNDMILPGGLARLQRRLWQGQAAAATGGIRMQPAFLWGDVALPSAEHRAFDAASPLLMLDRARLPPELVIEASPPEMELLKLLVLLRMDYAIDRALENTPLCVRQYAV